MQLKTPTMTNEEISNIGLQIEAKIDGFWLHDENREKGYVAGPFPTEEFARVFCLGARYQLEDRGAQYTNEY